MLTLGDIYMLYSGYKAAASAMHGRWREVAAAFDNEILLPKPETDEVVAASGPNLIRQGVEFYSRAVSSTMWDVDSPAVRPSSASSRRRAQDRVRAIKGWHAASGLGLGAYQRARYHMGYGASPVVIRPHPGMSGVPRWEIRNPHCVLPGPKDLDYLPAVPDAFITVLKSAKWLRDTFGVDLGPKVRPDTMMEVAEYNGPEQVTLFCVGPATDDMPKWTWGTDPSWLGAWGPQYGQELRNRQIERISGPSGEAGRPWLLRLSSTPNLAGMCTVSYPGVISLSKLNSLVSGLLPRSKLHARLLDEWIKAASKDIHPNEWALLNEGGELITPANGLKGTVGEIRDGTIFVSHLSPGYGTGPIVDRIESYSRGDGGISVEFGGQSGENIRTGRRGEQVQATAVDPVVEEVHKTFQIALEHENRIAVALSKGAAGGRSVSFYVPKARSKELVTYVPNEIFETDETSVRYPIAGVDASGLAIRTIQQSGAGILSQHDVRVLSPDVEDVDATEARIRVEALEAGALAALNQILVADPEGYALALDMAAQGELVPDIFRAVQRAAQERLATSGAPGEPTGPVDPASPEAQAGLGAPGIAEAGTIGSAPAGIRDIAMLMQNSRAPSRMVAAERAS